MSGFQWKRGGSTVRYRWDTLYSNSSFTSSSSPSFTVPSSYNYYVSNILIGNTDEDADTSSWVSIVYNDGSSDFDLYQAIEVEAKGSVNLELGMALNSGDSLTFNSILNDIGMYIMVQGIKVLL